VAPSPHRLAFGFLLAAGVVLCLAGGAAVGIGLLDPQLISDQLPPEALLDAQAVGGAAVALGVGTALLGVLHLVAAIALRLRMATAETAAVVLAAIMAMISFAFAISALVTITSGQAPAIIMLPAAIGLGAAAIGYAATSMKIIGSRKQVS
jgi:hypothetical protein